jgi:hypothetical protein
MANEQRPTADASEPAVYQITVKGHLGVRWGEWFGGMMITQTASGDTLISGLVADQAALYGLLRKVRDLGLPLLALSRSEPSCAHGPAAEESIREGAHNASDDLSTLRRAGGTPA